MDLTVCFLGVNGRGVQQTLRFFNSLKRRLNLTNLKLAGVDLREVSAEVGNMLDSFYLQTEDPSKYLNHRNTYIISTPSAFNVKNPVVEYARRKNIPVIEFSDFIKFLRDRYLEHATPIPQEYFNEDLSAVKNLLKHIENLVRNYDVSLEGFITSLIKEAQILRFYFYRLPPQMKLIGITGTDGKTTTSSMIFHILKSLNKKVAMITTVEARWYDGEHEERLETGLHTTTPSTDELIELFDRFVARNIEYVILEVTSHALVQLRVAGLKFDVAVVTNVASEHIDYHRSVERYQYAKTLIVSRHLKSEGISVFGPQAYTVLESKIPNDVKRIVVNLPEESHPDEVITTHIAELERKFTATEPAIRYRYLGVESSFEGELKTLFNFNLENLALAFSTAEALSLGEYLSSELFSNYRPPTGRGEILWYEPLVIVDFAHTPLALEALLAELSKWAEVRQGRLYVVFGCAGERDPTKRPAMGEIAYRYAHNIYLTAEDPRREDLYQINQAILEGMRQAGANLQIRESADTYEKYVSDGKVIYSFFKPDVSSREAAIRQALLEASSNDIVVITGKGHEQSLAFGLEEYEWNDIEVTRKILDELHGRQKDTI